MAQSFLRKYLPLFGGSGPTASFEQFGSKVQLGNSVQTKDPASITSLTAWLQGWQNAVYGSNKAPIMEDMNGAFLAFCYQLCYKLQEGIPEWDSSTTYNIGSIVKRPYNGSTLNFDTYVSIVDGNTGNALPSLGITNSYWAPWAGGRGQVVQNTGSTLTAVSSTSNVATVITVTITPTSTNSRIKISTSFPFSFLNAGSGSALLFLYRNGGSVFVTSEAPGGAGGAGMHAIFYIDSPATTSPVTYTIYAQVTTGSTLYVGSIYGWAITAEEIL